MGTVLELLLSKVLGESKRVSATGLERSHSSFNKENRATRSPEEHNRTVRQQTLALAQG